MDRIQIRNLGPIREVDFEVKDFMIFIGPNAGGKSTISKVINAFYAIKLVIVNYSGNNFQDDINILNYFSTLKITEKTFISFQYSKDNQSLFSLIISTNSNGDKYKISYNLDAIKLSIMPTCMPIFMPSGRILSSILPKIDSSFTDNLTYEIYKKQIKHAYRNAFNLEQHEEKMSDDDHCFMRRNQLAIKLSHSILKGKYLNMHDIDVLFFNDKDYINMENASSGQQASLWVLNFIVFFIIVQKSKIFFLEEPEAHLFPETQKQIVELISLCSSTTPGNQVIITTHSPYILSATNNLLYAYRVGQKKPEEVGKVIDPLLWLDPKRVGAYFVDNGTIRSIMDDKLEMIKSEEIDNASRILNDEFDQIFDLEDLE